MKVKVVSQFNDKITGKLRKVGQVFECEPDRANELAGYVEPVPEKEPKRA